MLKIIDIILYIYHFILYLFTINLQIPNENFSGKSALEPGLLFLTETFICDRIVYIYTHIFIYNVIYI